VSLAVDVAFLDVPLYPTESSLSAKRLTDMTVKTGLLNHASQIYQNFCQESLRLYLSQFECFKTDNESLLNFAK